MAPTRRIGTEDSKSRAALLDAAERLLVDEGYAAVTSRKVAAAAGLKPQLVHYYFRTMDDLYLAAFRRRADEGLRRQDQVLASAEPLRALWDFSSAPAGIAFAMEFNALGTHRPAIRAEIGRYAELFRTKQLEVLAEVFQRYGIDTDEFPPVALLVLMTSVSRMVVMEERLGMSAGHAETRALVERLIDRFEPHGHD
jgi:AcrR family transcriptional regulator